MFTENETMLLSMLLNKQIKLYQNALRKTPYSDTHAISFYKKRIKNYKEILKKILDN